MTDVTGRALASILLAAGLAAPAVAAEQGPWQIRGRALGIFPDTDATIGALPGADVDIGATATPELDISYFLTGNIAVELVLATARVGVKVTNPDISLGNVWILPPTLTVQYHFAPDGAIRPYVGVGVNYTMFYSDKQPPGGFASSVDYDNAWGFALQAGVDIPVDDQWSMNVDVKKIFLATDATVNGAVKADVDIDPLLVGIGIGYRF